MNASHTSDAPGRDFGAVQLHDASLLEIRVNWSQHTAGFFFQMAAGKRAEILFEGVRSIELPHENPWGPSDSVNSVRALRPRIFEIEMQSGDILRIHAVSWIFSSNV
jgi:hypothetical protein